MSQMLPERRRARALEPWEPFQELDQIGERMRRVLDETFGGLPGLRPLLREGGAWSPMVDIEEQDDAYVVEAELPGVKRDDVTVELVGNELAITGELKEKERTGTLRRQTRRTGRFDYRVRLSETVDTEAVQASLADGVLTVRVPKSERAERRQIDITGG